MLFTFFCVNFVSRDDNLEMMVNIKLIILIVFIFVFVFGFHPGQWLVFIMEANVWEQIECHLDWSIHCVKWNWWLDKWSLCFVSYSTHSQDTQVQIDVCCCFPKMQEIQTFSSVYSNFPHKPVVIGRQLWGKVWVGATGSNHHLTPPVPASPSRVRTTKLLDQVFSEDVGSSSP